MLGYCCKRILFCWPRVRAPPVGRQETVEAEPEPDAPSTLSFDRRHFIDEGQETLSLRKVKVQLSHNEH